MHPDFRIVVDDQQDITDNIKKHLTELAVVDQMGIDSDTATLTLADDGSLEIPRKGSALSIWMGYQNNLQYMGKYHSETPELSEGSMRITCKAFSTQSDLKSQRTHAWENTTLKDMIDTIATRNGLQPTVAEKLASVLIERSDQKDESDMNLLTRMAIDHQAIFKVADNRLLFVIKAGGESASGKALATIKLDKSQITGWRVSPSGRAEYKKVIANYRDLRAATQYSKTAGNGSLTFTIPKLYATADEAQRAADSRYKVLAMQSFKLSITMAGDNRIIAGAKLELFVRNGIPSQWSVIKVEHRQGSGGYVSVVDAESVSS